MDGPYAYVGRQPIYDRRNRVIAYELLYRDSEENRARFDSASQATAATIINSVVELGLSQLAGTLPVYVNVPPDFIFGKLPLPLPPEQTVLEVLEDIPVTPELITALKGLKAKGFKVALDDFVLSDATRPLIEVADVIKVDVLGVERGTLAAQYAELRPFGVPLIAEKITTPEEYAWLRSQGFDLFQGHFFDLPVISKSRRLPHNRAAMIQLLSKIYAPRVDIRAIETLIAADVGLSVRLIKLASSAASSRGVPIGTLGQAIQRLGLEQLASFVVVSLAAGFDDKPFELARRALIRARMCAALARTRQIPSDQLFTAGLLSLVDALLDLPLEEVTKQLPLTPLIHGALRLNGTAPEAKIVEAARAQDRGDFAKVAATGIPAQTIFLAWYESVQWADQLLAQL